MYKILLFTHIAVGTVALLSGAGAILSRKGGKFHTKAGIVYYLSMYGVTTSAFVMTLMKFNPFLLAIAIFSFYMTYAGKKAIDYWRLKQTYIPTLKDRLPGYIGIVTSIFMMVYPVVQMKMRHEAFVPVLSVFGVILLFLTFKDVRSYADAGNFVPHNKRWLLDHISRMSGAYIATFTAFLVNNVTFHPGWVLWLGPTVVGVPLIVQESIKWSKTLKIKPR